MESKLKTEFNLEISYDLMIPGFVETGLPTHQELHVDSKDVDVDKPFHQLILHMPLDEEGIFLRLRKVKVNEGGKRTQVPQF